MQAYIRAFHGLTDGPVRVVIAWCAITTRTGPAPWKDLSGSDQGRSLFTEICCRNADLGTVLRRREGVRLGAWNIRRASRPQETRALFYDSCVCGTI